MDISQLDKKLLIHVASELVIVGGITFWLNSKINAKDLIIEKQEKEIKDLQDRLQKIELFLSNAFGGQSARAPPQPPQPSKPSKKKKREQSPTASEEEEFHTSKDEEIEI